MVDTFGTATLRYYDLLLPVSVDVVRITSTMKPALGHIAGIENQESDIPAIKTLRYTPAS